MQGMHGRDQKGGGMFKIIDYEGATVEDGFPNEFKAQQWMYSNYSRECIRELEFEIREEVEDEQTE